MFLGGFLIWGVVCSGWFELDLHLLLASVVEKVEFYCLSIGSVQFQDLDVGFTLKKYLVH